MMRWKTMLCLLLCALCAAAGAAAMARMPARMGAVTDSADILSAETAADFAAYAGEAQAETDLRLSVALVHFFDGLDAQAYADALFAAWDLGENDVLLCGAAGEDAFATAMGGGAAQVLGRQSADSLMYTSSRFSELFASQQYDAAIGEYCRAFNALLGKQTGAEISLSGLFGAPEAAATTAQPAAHSALWDEVSAAIDSSSREALREGDRRADDGPGAGSWIVLLALALIVLRSGRSARTDRPRGGCGCSPLGWLMNLLGVTALIDALKKRR